ncbi:MAG: competence/damage-inducible protein A [Candidatus Marinimicrobia bacterium]|nr:competence/damage-inducible protein A [Candidatus Neomarinimicrobiota bacterium]
MKAIIISIGDELLSGDIANTNGSFIASKLNEHNIPVIRILAVGDDADSITKSLEEIPEMVNIVFVTGGLGPTHDDITTKVAARFFDSELVFQQDLYDRVKARFAGYGIPMNEADRLQAFFPENCERIDNNYGTAIGMHFFKNGRDYFFMPGVPHEMKGMLTEQILPKLISGSHKKMQVRTLRTYGVGESKLYQSMKHWMEENPNIRVAFYPKDRGNDIKLQYYPDSEKAVENLIQQLSDSIYGFDSEEIEEKIAKKLIEKKWTLAVAESCTGGLIASRLTDISGSSQYMMYGIVSYSNDAKMKLLGVKEESLKKYGAVSQEVAAEMAEGVRQYSDCEIGISTTGIAGPTGGTAEKPVGTLWCAVSCLGKSEVFHYCRNINREANKIRFTQFALKKLLEKLK